MVTYPQVILSMARAGVSLAHQSGRTLEDVNDNLMAAMETRQTAEAEEYFRELEIGQWLEVQVFEGVE